MCFFTAFDRSRKQGERKLEVFQVRVHEVTGRKHLRLVTSMGRAWIISGPESRSNKLLFQGTQSTLQNLKKRVCFSL